MQLAIAALTGLLAGFALLYAVAFAANKILDHGFEEAFLAVYDCEATGRSFAACSRSGIGTHLRRLNPPPILAPSEP